MSQGEVTEAPKGAPPRLAAFKPPPAANVSNPPPPVARLKPCPDVSLKNQGKTPVESGEGEEARKPQTPAERREALRQRLRGQINGRRDARTSHFAMNCKCEMQEAREEAKKKDETPDPEEQEGPPGPGGPDPLDKNKQKKKKKASRKERAEERHNENKMKKGLAKQGLQRKLEKMGLGDTPLAHDLSFLQRSGNLKPHNAHQTATHLVEQMMNTSK